MPAIDTVVAAKNRSRVIYVSPNANKTIAVVKLVRRCGLSELLSDGISAAAKMILPIVKTISCQIILLALLGYNGFGYIWRNVSVMV